MSQMLIIAGSDSSGGAGIARDVETASAFGVKTALALTAVTAQTHSRVIAVEPVPPAFITAQIEAALAANRIDAIKIGMIGTPEAAQAIGTSLGQHPNIPSVLDPVLAASSGGTLARAELGEAIIRHILPHLALITPNLIELAQLIAASATRVHPLDGKPQPFPLHNDTSTLQHGKALLNLGAKAVLVKGGHAQGVEATDYLLTADNTDPQAFSTPRLNATMRGTGCTLASAITAGLAKGDNMVEAMTHAKTYVSALIAKSGEPLENSA